MKKLYRKGQVHPSPSPSSSSSSPSHFSLSFLPATIFTLATALSTDDREVLAYLLSSSTTPFLFNPSNSKSLKSHHNHSPSFTCYCFNCYTNYWARWDSSPNRQLIHEIIDAFEDGLLANQNNKKQSITRKAKRKGNKNNLTNHGIVLDKGSHGSIRVDANSGRVDPVEEESGDKRDETGEKQGSVRKLVSFIGERIWGSVWG